MPKLSIFAKLLICIVIAVCLLSAIIISVSNSLTRSFVANINQQVSTSLGESTDQFLLSHTRTTLDYLEQEVREELYFADADGIKDELSKFAKDSNIDEIIVFDSHQKILASAYSNDHDKMVKIYTSLQQEVKSRTEIVTKLEHNIAIVRNIYLYDEYIGSVFISTNHNYYDRELTKLDESTRLLSKQHEIRYRTRLTILIIVFTFVFVVFSSAVISHITAPLQQLKSDIKHFGDDSKNTYTFSQRGHDEIAQLSRSFHKMSLKVRKRELQISQLAETDSLTKLNNRASLINKIDTLINTEKYENLMCIYLDLDNFKDINDTFGHQEGDRLIIEVSKRLQHLISSEYEDKVLSHCFNNNLFLSRLGGDEFVLLFQFDQQTPFSKALSETLAQRVLSAFDGKLLDYNTCASFGISLYPQDGESVEELLKTSDIAMYHAKALGRNQYQFFSHDMSIALMRARDIEQALQDALENDLTEQFYLAYQPQYRLKDNAFVGVEALIRWQHPELGTLSPDEFIPIAERRDLITQFTLMTFDLLINDALHLKSQIKQDFMISWNLSTVVLLKVDIAQLLLRKLHNKGLSSKNISIEITETALISDLALANKNIYQLQQHGFKVWLDDFGTGYSSLSLLSDLPIDGLKIDRSFVNKIQEVQDHNGLNIEAENNSKIIDAFIKLADTLHLCVVAEGIETQYQFDYLNKLGCGYGQGYYLNRPMPLNDLMKLTQAL